MQSRFPEKDRENGKTSVPYAVLQGFAEIFPDFEPWLAARIEADAWPPVRQARVEFAGRGAIGPGALSDSAALRDLDPRSFVANLIRISRRMQVWQYSPARHAAVELVHGDRPQCPHLRGDRGMGGAASAFGMPFDDIRRIAAVLQRIELEQMKTLRSLWVKARVHIWDLGDFSARPAGVLARGAARSGGDPDAVGDHLPQA